MVGNKKEHRSRKKGHSPLRYRMDNSATIYPMVVTKTSQSLFGLGAELAEPIDKELFLNAINLSFERYPYFKVRIKCGFFRPYFEQNDKPYILHEKRNFPLEPISFPNNNGYPFLTEIHEKKVYMIFFHALCDANGGMEFLKTVLHAYVALKEKDISSEGVRHYLGQPDSEEHEDAFERYYKKFPLISGAKNMAGGYAYGVTHEFLSNNHFAGSRVSCDTDALLATAKKHNCTVTVFIVALLALAIYSAHDKKTHKNDYVFFVPVNYRKHFPSESLRNFTGFARCVIPYGTEFTLEKLLSVLSEEMKKQLDKEELHKKLSFSSLMSKNPFMVAMPYFLKRRISLWGRGIGKLPRQTMIVSNIGKVNFPPNEDIKRFFFYVNCNARTPENVGVLSYNGKTEICFVRKIASDETEKTFRLLLSEFLPCQLFKEYID